MYMLYKILWYIKESKKKKQHFSLLIFNLKTELYVKILTNFNII